jgi:hypothetical protein
VAEKTGTETYFVDVVGSDGKGMRLSNFTHFDVPEGVEVEVGDKVFLRATTTYEMIGIQSSYQKWAKREDGNGG